MDPLVFGVVLAAALMHAGWNTLVKVGGDPLVRLAITNGVAALIMLPLAFVAGVPATESWPYLAASVVIHLLYYAFLVLSYRTADLSLAYPIARGSAPPLVAVGAFFFAGETLSPLGATGVVLITAAIAVIALRVPRRGGGGGGRSVIYALCTGTAIAGYSVMDGMGARVSGDVPAYIVWMFLLDGLPLALAVFYLRGHAFLEQVRAHWRLGTVSGVLATGAYALVIWAMTLTPMTYVSALRETSVIAAAFIGSRVLKEPFGARRVSAACLVAAGVILLQASRHV